MYSQRVSSKIGTTTKLGNFLQEWTLEEQNSGGSPAINYTSEEYLKNAEAGLQRTYKDLGMDSLKLNSQYAFHSIPAFIQGADETEQYYFHPDHLGSSNYITNFVGTVTQHMEYFAFGETFVEEHKNSHNSPYKYNGKELDEETGWYYYGARFYDPRVSLWLSVDPLAEKTMDAYWYCGQNPINFIDPDGRCFIGTDGKRVDIQVVNDEIILGNNASKELQRMALMINNSGSSKARSQFMGIANNETKVHFKIEKNKINNRLLGLHQAHDANGKALNWDDKTNTWDGKADYITDVNGNLVYREATITIFEGNFDQSDINDLNWMEAKNFSLEDAMVVTMSHETEHNLNIEDIITIKGRFEGVPSTRDIEEAAENVEIETSVEIGVKRDPAKAEEILKSDTTN